jgi:ATP-dependent RNA helicase RhlE
VYASVYAQRYERCDRRDNRMNQFLSLGLSEPLLRAIAQHGYVTPTPVQQKAIPAILRGNDVWASAQTGSGKTAAFVLPMLQCMRVSPAESRRWVRALVLVPTRELAMQTAESMEKYGVYLPNTRKVCVAIGGVSINPQMMDLRGGADVVVATPGRLLDLIDHNALTLSAIDILVLDEADKLLSMGFADELARIFALLPTQRQNLLFSATFPPSVQALAATILRNPTHINVDAGNLVADNLIVQRSFEVDPERRVALFHHLLTTHGWSRVLVFVASRSTAEHVAEKLIHLGVSAAPLHGDLSQGARTKALADFKSMRITALVATDVAARGLDIVELPAVVNYDLPRSPTDYLHRIGRTGRAGVEGTAISFVGVDMEAHFRLIERRHRLSIVRECIEGFERTATATQTQPNGGVKGKRKSKKDKLREAMVAATVRTSDTK